jgi:hypothetical protein
VRAVEVAADGRRGTERGVKRRGRRGAEAAQSSADDHPRERAAASHPHQEYDELLQLDWNSAERIRPGYAVGSPDTLDTSKEEAEEGDDKKKDEEYEDQQHDQRCQYKKTVHGPVELEINIYNSRAFAWYTHLFIRFHQSRGWQSSISSGQSPQYLGLHG